MRRILPFAMVALSAALSAAPARAAIVMPLSVGGVTFAGFRDFNGPINASCSAVFFGLGSASCSAPSFYSGGPLGPGFHVTGSRLGIGTTAAGANGANPTATAFLSNSGGDTIDGTPTTGMGGASVTSQLQYYVTVLPLNTLPTAGLKIPLIFTDAGSINGTASSTATVGGEAYTHVHAFEGLLEIDGSHSFISDIIDDTVNAGVLSQTYGNTHSVVFDYTEGDTVAEVDLFASCNGGSVVAGFGTISCSASADPFFGFDQAAFDVLMGSHTFNLSDFFAIEISGGLEPAVSAGVPEPATWTLMIAGLGLAGAALRRRRAHAAVATS